MHETNSTKLAACISREELYSASQAVAARWPSGVLEARRIALARELLDSGFALSRALTLHTRASLVNHRGSLGTQDVTVVTESLFAALADYAERIRQVAAACQELPWADQTGPVSKSSAEPSTAPAA